MPKTSGIGFHGVTTISEFLFIQSLILYNYTVYIYIYIYIFIYVCALYVWRLGNVFQGVPWVPSVEVPSYCAAG